MPRRSFRHAHRASRHLRSATRSTPPTRCRIRGHRIIPLARRQSPEMPPDDRRSCRHADCRCGQDDFHLRIIQIGAWWHGDNRSGHGCRPDHGERGLLHGVDSHRANFLTQTFRPCIPASAANTNITITTTADATASNVSVVVMGVQQMIAKQPCAAFSYAPICSRPRFAFGRHRSVGK